MRLPVLRPTAASVLLSVSMMAPPPGNAPDQSSQTRNQKTFLRSASAVLWDVDGTLVDSTGLGFTATNEVLSTNSYRIIDEADYKLGCRYTTPDRFNFHVQQPPGSEEGKRLGDIFDATYVNRVSERTAGLFDGMEQLLRSLALSGHPQGVLSNACGAYVRAVVAANALDEVPGQRIALFGVVVGADEVAEAKPSGAGLLHCCEVLDAVPEASVYVGDSPTDGQAARNAGMLSIGVTWGANKKSDLVDHFDSVVTDVPALIVALRDALGDSK